MEILKIYLYTLVHSQLSNQLCDKIGLLILHVLLFLIWAFYKTFTISLIGFRLGVFFLGPDTIYRYYLGKYSRELAPLVLIPYGYYCSFHSSIVIGCIIFLSPFLDVAWVPMPTASFLLTLKTGILSLHVFQVWGVKGCRDILEENPFIGITLENVHLNLLD